MPFLSFHDQIFNMFYTNLHPISFQLNLNIIELNFFQFKFNSILQITYCNVIQYFHFNGTQFVENQFRI
jgi:hypothetical protein